MLRRLTSMNTWRPLAPAMLLVAVTALAGCSSSSSGATVESNGGSCAVVIEMGGTSYIAGRQSKVALPLTTEKYRARTARCDEGGEAGPQRRLLATKIRRIAVDDAVAADGYQVDDRGAPVAGRVGRSTQTPPAVRSALARTHNFRGAASAQALGCSAEARSWNGGYWSVIRMKA